MAEWFHVTRMAQVLITLSFVTLSKSLSLWVFCLVICKRRELSKVTDSQGFLLGKFDSVSEEVTRLKELGEGYHLCLSDTKNTSRLQNTHYDNEWVLP